MTSDVPLVLADGTGTVSLDARHLAPGPEWLTDTRRTGVRPAPGELYLRADRTLPTSGYVQREFAIASGTEVTVVGRMALDAEGRLRPARGAGPLLVSARTPTELAAGARRDSASRRRGVRRLATVGLGVVVVMNAVLLAAAR